MEAVVALTRVVDGSVPDAQASTKGTNHPMSPPEPPQSCKLYVNGTPLQLVARGTVYTNLGPTLHHKQKDDGWLTISVTEVLVADAHVPKPTEEVTTVGEAINQFISWPI